jgi:hypothetical protein
LLNFFQTTLGQNEACRSASDQDGWRCCSRQTSTSIRTTGLSVSYNFNHSRKENETFEVATYGTSANGTEGDPARINVINANWFTTLSASKLNEFHCDVFTRVTSANRRAVG